MYDIFISHAADDSEYAETLLKRLQAQGYNVFWDWHERIRAVDDWQDKDRIALGKSSVVIACVSKAYFASPLCRQEIDYAASMRKLLPLAIEPVGWEAWPRQASFACNAVAMAKFESSDFWAWLCQELAGAFGITRPKSVGSDKDRSVADSKARDDLIDWISKTPLQLMQTAARKPALTLEMLDEVDRILENSGKVFGVPDSTPKKREVLSSRAPVKPTVNGLRGEVKLSNGFTYNEALYQRPCLFIEDRGKDAEAICMTVSGAFRNLTKQSTMLLVDDPGRDTWISAMKMMLNYQDLRVVTPCYKEGLKNQLSRINARLSPTAGQSFSPEADKLLGQYQRQPDKIKTMLGRYEDLEPEALVDRQTFIDAIDRHLRPGGICICDVELRTLTFPFRSEKKQRLKGVDAAWEACQKKGAELWILSGLKDFGITPGKDFRDLGIPVSERILFQKDNDLAAATDMLSEQVGQRFSRKLRMRFDEGPVECSIRAEDVARVEATAHLVIGPVENGRFTLSGNAVLRPIEVQERSGRGRVLRKLVEDKLARRDPIPLSNRDIESMLQVDVAERQTGRDEGDWTPAQVIYEIKSLLHEERKCEIVPHGQYSLGENAVVAIIEKEVA
jgi:hypothetical protein